MKKREFKEYLEKYKKKQENNNFIADKDHADTYSHQDFQVLMYDGSGRRTIGLENIKAEVDRREREWIAKYGSSSLISAHNINNIYVDTSGSMTTTIRDIKINDAEDIIFSYANGCWYWNDILWWNRDDE